MELFEDQETLEQACNTPPVSPPDEDNCQLEDRIEADKVASSTSVETPISNAHDLEPPAASPFSAFSGGGQSPGAGVSQVNDVRYPFTSTARDG